MLRWIRMPLVASLIALHATVMLCGPCLHELPGLGHCGAAASQPVGISAATGDVGLGPHRSADDCAVCHLLSMGQWLSVETPPANAEAVAARPPDLPAPPSITSDHPPRPSRAPPSLLS